MAGLFALKITSIFCCCSLRRPIVCTTDLSSHQRPTGPNCVPERAAPAAPFVPAPGEREPVGPPGVFPPLGPPEPGPEPPGPGAPGGGPPWGGPPGLCPCAVLPSAMTLVRHAPAKMTSRNRVLIDSSVPPVSLDTNDARPTAGIHSM